MHYATRTALGTPFRHDDENYVNFDERMNKLAMLTFGERRIIASIIFHITILRGDITSELVDIIKIGLHVPTYTSRSPNIFVFNRGNIIPKRPLHIAMTNINLYKDIFNFDDSTDVIRKKRKLIFLI